MLFLGDFNADCKYVKAHDWPSIRLRSSEVFKWLIPDSADTTVGNSDCAYDRIVVSGAHLRRSLKPHSASVHNFQEEFDLDQTQVSVGRAPADTLASPSGEGSQNCSLGGVYTGACSSKSSYSQGSLECQAPRKGLLAHFCSLPHGSSMRPKGGYQAFTASLVVVVCVGGNGEHAAPLPCCPAETLPLSFQALAISDHFPVEVTIKPR